MPVHLPPIHRPQIRHVRFGRGRLRRAPAITSLILATALALSGCAAGATPATGAAGSSQSPPAPGTAASAADHTGTSSIPSADASTAQQPVGSAAPPAGQVGADGCITNFDPAVDYFPDKSTLTHAKDFTVAYHDSYQVLTVAASAPGAKPATIVLVRCGAPKPALTGELAGASEITTPVHSLYSGSTSQLPSLVELDRLDVLTGVSDGKFISEKAVLQRISAGTIVQFAPGGTVDAEKIVAGHPDVFVTDGFDDPGIDAKITAAGIPVIAGMDWQEADPLGRAEWIKFFAALTGTEAAAAAQFATVSSAYTRTAALAKDAPKVAVVPGQPYQGTWYVPGGRSYTGRLIADAGGTYAWAADPSTGSVSSTFESVFARSADAPVWLASTTWTTRKQALTEDPRFATFAAFKSGNVWNAAKDVTAAGGNNFYELGAARPDLILADLVAILHPDLAPEHEFTFYLKLP